MSEEIFLKQEIPKELLDEFNMELKKMQTQKIPHELKDIGDCLFLNYAINHFISKGERHRILSPNIASYIYGKPNFEKLKQKYIDSQKGNPAELNGWLREAHAGNLKGIACGALINFQKKYSIPLKCKKCKHYHTYLKDLILESSLEVKSPVMEATIKTSDLKFPTTHLTNFDLLSSLSQLYGVLYNPVKKLMWYQAISLSVPEHLKIIEFGDYYLDSRVHGIYFLPSGKGKLNIKGCFNRIANSTGKKYEEPRSSHHEQHVGKIINRGTRKKPEFHRKLGYLAADILVSEEAHDEMTSKDPSKIETRNHHIVSMDAYGRNRIAKFSIDNLDSPEERIEYFSPTIHIKFSQPKMLPPDIVESGLYRRPLKIYIPAIFNIVPQGLHQQKLIAKNNHSYYLETFSEYLKKISLLKGKWEFQEGIEKYFLKYHQALVNQGLLWGGRRKNYSIIMDFPLMDFLIKLSCLQAISNLTLRVSKKDVIKSYIDLTEFFAMDLDFIQDKIRGMLDYGVTFKGANWKQQEWIMWLVEQNAIDADSKVKTIDFIKYIASTFDDKSNKSSKENKARKKFDELVREDYVKSITEGFGKDRVAYVHSLINPLKSSINTINTIITSPEKPFFSYNEAIKTIFPSGNYGNYGNYDKKGGKKQ